MNLYNDLDIILKEFENSRNILEKGIPNSMMKWHIEINSIIEKYKELSNEEKKQVHNKVTTDMAWFLLGFSIQMATYSLRFSEQKYFSNGLIALGIVLEILDKREVLLVMPLYYDVHRRRGFLFKEILEQNDDLKQIVLDFLNRNEQDKTLECMGYKLTRDDNNNLIYYRTW